MKTKKELREFLIKNLWFVETSEPWDGYLCKKCWRMVFDPDYKHRNLNRETCDSDEIIHVREVTEKQTPPVCIHPEKDDNKPQEPINTDLEVLREYVSEIYPEVVDNDVEQGWREACASVLAKIKSLIRGE